MTMNISIRVSAAALLCLAAAACVSPGVKFADENFARYTEGQLARNQAAVQTGLAPDPAADAAKALGFVSSTPQAAVRLHLIAAMANYRAGESALALEQLDAAKEVCGDATTTECEMATIYHRRLNGIIILSDAGAYERGDWPAVEGQARDYRDAVFATWPALPEGASEVTARSSDIDRNGRLMALCELPRAYPRLMERMADDDASVEALQQSRNMIRGAALDGLALVGHDVAECSGGRDESCLRRAWEDTHQLCTSATQ